MRPCWRASLASQACAAGLASAPPRRAFHRTKALVTIRGPEGEEPPYEADIYVGDAHEAFVYLRPEDGRAIRSSISLQLGGLGEAQGASQGAPQRLALQFHHRTRHFAYKSLDLPRINISRHMPVQPGSKEGISPATLWLSGQWYAITLNGSYDENFEKQFRDRAYRIKCGLERLMGP